MDKLFIASQFEQLQDLICKRIEEIDGLAFFKEDNWNREEGGGGRTRIIEEGGIIEKGGVNFSAVHGPVSDLMKKQLGLDGKEFFATGVSIVLHPHNPNIPIIHMNVRYFEMDTGVFWFGGGIDLTPHYLIPENAALFHKALKNVCDGFKDDAYNAYKKWADDYFYIPHRDETRGVGGIFFDHLDQQSGKSKSEILNFCINLGKLFPEVYQQQVELGKDKPFGIEELKWRNIRRGRYVEFNLVHDRGTKFGLLTGGRTESILMSLPKEANWFYNYIPESNSAEELSLKMLKKGIDWISLGN
jgi:coproporphyrinogen III oxidase